MSVIKDTAIALILNSYSSKFLESGSLWLPVHRIDTNVINKPILENINPANLVPFFRFRTHSFDSSVLPYEHHLSFEYSYGNNPIITIQLYDPSGAVLQEVLRHDFKATDKQVKDPILDSKQLLIEYGWLSSEFRDDKLKRFGNRFSGFTLATMTGVEYEYGANGPTLTISAAPTSVPLMAYKLNPKNIPDISVPAQDPVFANVMETIINKSLEDNKITNLQFAVRYIGLPTGPVDFGAMKSMAPDSSENTILSMLKWMIDNDIFPIIDGITAGYEGSRYAAYIPGAPDPYVSAKRGIPTFVLYIVDKVYISQFESTKTNIILEWPSHNSPIVDVSFEVDSTFVMLANSRGVIYRTINEDGEIEEGNLIPYKEVAGFDSKSKTGEETLGNTPERSDNTQPKDKAMLHATVTLLGDPLFEPSEIGQHTVELKVPTVLQTGRYKERTFVDNFPQLSQDFKARFGNVSSDTAFTIPFEGIYNVVSLTHSISADGYITTLGLNWIDASSNSTIQKPQQGTRQT